MRSFEAKVDAYIQRPYREATYEEETLQEKLYAIDEALSLLESAIDSLEDVYEFSDIRDDLESILEEAKRKEQQMHG